MVAAPGAHATYPGANGKLAFGVGNQVLTIDPDGSNETPLTDTSCGYDAGGWSPDGTQLAFRKCTKIDVMNADGSGAHFVAGPVVGFLVGGASWSPDSSKIAFEEVCCRASGVGSFFNIRVINADGTGNTALTSDGHSIGTDWSPDGTKIAFTRIGVSDGGLYTMNPDGSGATKVPNTTIHDVGSSWSPDGRQLTFSRQSPVDGHRDIYKINVDGTGLTRLTEGVHSYASTWSPDGRKIAFISFRRPPTPPDQYTLTVINSDGSGQTPVTVKSFIGGPSWQPIPNRSPDCSGVAALRPVLAIANRRLVPITLDGATDPDGDAVKLTVDAVTQDEPVVSRGDSTSPDVLDDGDGQLRVRAERNPHGDGRVYRIAFTASDGRGGSCSGAATVSVPRKKHKPAVDSAPPSYDSFGS